MTGSAPLASPTQAAILIAALGFSPSLHVLLAVELITQVTFLSYTFWLLHLLCLHPTENFLTVGSPHGSLLHILGLLQVPLFLSSLSFLIREHPFLMASFYPILPV